MYIFKCRECEKRCYSASSLETHLNPYLLRGDIYTEIVKTCNRKLRQMFIVWHIYTRRTDGL